MTHPTTDPVRAPDRLAALRRLGALDTPSEAGLDALTELTRELLGVPVALVSLVDEDRQFFKSCLGLPEPWATARETPLSHSFCRHAIGGDEPLVIDNAREHPLVMDNPAIEELGVVSYLGIPLRTHDGHALGTLCAIDHEPRKWSQDDIALMRLLSQAVIQRLELRARMEQLQDAKAALEERETYFRSLIEKGLSAVMVLDAEGLIRYASPNVDEILGFGPEERIGRSGFEHIHPDEVPRLRKELAWTAGESGRSMRVEFRYLHPDGDVRWIEGVGSNRLDEPAVAGIVFNFRDVTEERRTEEELRQRQKLETVGELTTGIAHDFNNLLAVVLANADLLEEGLSPGADEARRDLEDLRAAARGGADLIRSLMSFSRRAEPALRPIHVGRVVEQTARMLRRILPSAIRVHTDVPPELPPAKADPRAVEQILLNLAINSRDAMPDGGDLTIRVRPRAERVVLEVEDTGTGMDSATLKRAFQPFFTTKAEGAGTGLGLAMVARLVGQHNGRFDAESEPGKGTLMRVELPVAEGEVAPDMEGRGPAVGSGAGEVVLVVEDEEALRRTAQRVLERAGYTVLVAPDGQKGLETFRERKDQIALVLSDQDMPLMTGVQLMEEIRAAGSRVPFVLTTGYTRSELTAQAPDDLLLLPKPWTLRDLTEAVRTALREMDDS